MYIAEKGVDALEPSNRIVRVQWKNFGPYEAKWEMANQMQAMYPSLFAVEENQFWYMSSYMFWYMFS